MEDFQHIAYSKSVIEFVAVAKEYCDFVESTTEMQPLDFIERLQKFLPLIYLKGAMLPKVDNVEAAYFEDNVTEDDYNRVVHGVANLLKGNDDYLEVFDEDMQFSEGPVVKNISEGVADVYQDLNNFLANYKGGVTELMEEALWMLNEQFEMYWGKTCANLLRAIHNVRYKLIEEKNETEQF